MNFTEKQIDKYIKITIALIVIVVLASAGAYFYYYKKPTLGKLSINEQQIAELQKKVEKKPRDAVARFYLAQAYMKDDQFDDAIAELKQVVKLEPKSHLAYYYIGFAYKLKGKGSYDDAETYFNKVVKMTEKTQYAPVNPNLKSTFYFLGEMYKDKGNYKKALDYFTKSSKIGNVDSDALRQIADCYRLLKQYKKAEANYKEAVRFVPNYAEAHFGLGQVYVLTGKNGEAKKSFKLAIKYKPGYKQAKAELAKLK